MNALKAIVGKELLDFSRDRKTLLLTLLMTPVLMLVLIFGLGTFMQHKMKELNDKPLEVAIVGAQHAPNLVKWLAGRGVTAKNVADPDAAIRSQREDVYIRIGDKFEEQWRKGEPALVEVVKLDDTDDSAFVAKVSASGGALLWSTFLRTGFNEADNQWTRFPPGAATGIAIDPSGAVYVTGDADSFSDFKPSAGAFHTTTSDNQGAFVVKFAAAPSMTLSTSDASVDAQTPITLSVAIAGSALAGDVVFFDGREAIGGAPLTANRATLVTTLPIGIHALSAMLRIPGVSADTPVVYQVVDTPLACN